jgi:hypothetical protein
MTHVRGKLIAVVALGLLGLATSAALAKWLAHRNSSAIVTVTFPQRIGNWWEKAGCCRTRIQPEQWQASAGKRYLDGSAVVELQVLADVIGEGGVDGKLAARLDELLYGHSTIRKYDVQDSGVRVANDAHWRLVSGTGGDTIALAYWFELGRLSVTNRTSLKIRSISVFVSGRNNAAVVLASSECANPTCTKAIESIDELISELRDRSIMFTSISTHAASRGSE